MWNFSSSVKLDSSRVKEFVSVIAGIIRESSDKQLVLRIVNAFLFIHQPDRVALKASDVSAAD